MDDIRRPQQPQRRDYALPASQPDFQPQPQSSPYNPGPAPYEPAPTPDTQPLPQPAYQGPRPQPESFQPQTNQHPQPIAAPKPQPKIKIGGKKVSIAAGTILAAAAIFGAGWMLKGTGSSQTIPQSITRQVNYSLYFPSPMPDGYVYMKDTATFQIGQVYYKFASGTKRVTVSEQPMPEKRPDLSLMSGYRIFDSPVGQAAIGSSFGQATAVILTKTTVITMNSVGGVSAQELQTAINNLKLIGQNPQKA